VCPLTSKRPNGYVSHHDQPDFRSRLPLSFTSMLEPFPQCLCRLLCNRIGIFGLVDSVASVVDRSERRINRRAEDFYRQWSSEHSSLTDCLIDIVDFRYTSSSIVVVSRQTFRMSRAVLAFPLFTLFVSPAPEPLLLFRHLFVHPHLLHFRRRCNVLLNWLLRWRCGLFHVGSIRMSQRRTVIERRGSHFRYRQTPLMIGLEIGCRAVSSIPVSSSGHLVRFIVIRVKAGLRVLLTVGVGML
jgi:hypothetical protein